MVSIDLLVTERALFFDRLMGAGIEHQMRIEFGGGGVAVAVGAEGRLVIGGLAQESGVVLGANRVRVALLFDVVAGEALDAVPSTRGHPGLGMPGLSVSPTGWASSVAWAPSWHLRQDARDGGGGERPGLPAWQVSQPSGVQCGLLAVSADAIDEQANSAIQSDKNRPRC